MSADYRFYVADLAAYNNARLHGVWINALDELESIQEQVYEMLKKSPENDAEEWAIHDYDGFGGIRLSEYESFERLHDIARFLNEYDNFGQAVLEYFGGDLDDAKRAAEENYQGCYFSLADYAQEITEETSEIPSHLAPYIDYERLGRDMELNSEVITIEENYGKVHVLLGY